MKVIKLLCKHAIQLSVMDEASAIDPKDDQSSREHKHVGTYAVNAKIKETSNLLIC